MAWAHVLGEEDTIVRLDGVGFRPLQVWWRMMNSVAHNGANTVIFVTQGVSTVFRVPCAYTILSKVKLCSSVWNVFTPTVAFCLRRHLL
jgi:hypothetical protein